MHRITTRFLKCYENLPEPIQQLARKNFEMLKTNPSHPSLHFKKVGKFRSVRVGLNYRALAVEDGEDLIWVWIGTHDEYERMIKEVV
jgi:mRNA-degrading endonuclease RelE of RelBE toxin-antitoxin system